MDAFVPSYLRRGSTPKALDLSASSRSVMSDFVNGFATESSVASSTAPMLNSAPAPPSRSPHAQPIATKVSVPSAFGYDEGLHYDRNRSMPTLYADQQFTVPFASNEETQPNDYHNHGQRRDFHSFDASALPSHLTGRRQSQAVSSDHVGDTVIYEHERVAPVASTSYVPTSRSNSYTPAPMPTTFDPYNRRASVANYHSADVQSPASATQSQTTSPRAAAPSWHQRQSYLNGAEYSVSPLKVENVQTNVAFAPIAYREPVFLTNAAFRHDMQGTVAPSFSSPRSSISNAFLPSSPGTLGNFRARSSATPLLSRSARSSASSTWTSVPSTPTFPGYQGSGIDKAAFTDAMVLTDPVMSPGYDASFAATPMANNRSYSMASLGSAGESSVGPTTMGARGRSYSTSAVRNTTRSRPRHIEPPLVVSSADKQHACFCGKRFMRTEHLKRHSQVHTQERPFQCPVEACGRAFGRSDNLAQHLKTHARSTEQAMRVENQALSQSVADAAVSGTFLPTDTCPSQFRSEAGVTEADDSRSTFADLSLSLRQ